MTVDPRIELIGVVQLLSEGYPVKTELRFPYRTRVEKFFGRFADDPAVTTFAAMAGRGFSFDAPIALMLHLSAPPELEIAHDLPSELIARAGGIDTARAFLERLRRFALTTDFTAFFRDNDAFYTSLRGPARAFLERNPVVSQLETYYGMTQAGYTVVLSPLTKGAFGPRVEVGPARFQVFSVASPTRVEGDRLLFLSDDGLRYLVWHEFAHSFVNPLTAEHWSELRAHAHLLGSIAERLPPWYREWRAALNEHFVRAVTVRLADRYLGSEAAEAELSRQVEWGFLYVPAIAGRLKVFEAHRETYPSFRDFFPELVALMGTLPAVWGGLAPGLFNVGFSSIPGASNDVMIDKWFPTRTWNEERMTLGDYLALVDRLDTDFDRREENRVVDRITELATGSVDPQARERLAPLVKAPTFAQLNVDLAPGNFPLVVWSARHDVALYQFLTSEYLTSHGFIVASVRRVDDRLPPPWLLEDRDAKAEVLERHAEDLMGAVRRLNPDPSNNFGILSWSYGGESAIRLKNMDSRAAVIVSLSSNVLSDWVYAPDSLRTLDPASLDVPFVLMAERIATDGSSRPVPDIFSRLPAGSAYLEFPQLAHGNFNAIEGYLPALVGISAVQPWSVGGDDANLGYRLAVQAALYYLCRHLAVTGSTACVGTDLNLDGYPPNTLRLIEQ